MDNQFEKYTDEQAHRIAYLVAGYIKGTISKKEHDELDEWICENDENMELFEKLTDEKNIEIATRLMQEMDPTKIAEITGWPHNKAQHFLHAMRANSTPLRGWATGTKRQQQHVTG